MPLRQRPKGHDHRCRCTPLRPKSQGCSANNHVLWRRRPQMYVRARYSRAKLRFAMSSFAITTSCPLTQRRLRRFLDDAMIPWREHIKSGALTGVTLESLFERIRIGLRGMPIEVWHVPRDTELLISDNAALTFAYSIATRKSIGTWPSATHTVPRCRSHATCLVAIGAAAKDDVLLADDVDLFNELQVRNADAHVQTVSAYPCRRYRNVSLPKCSLMAGATRVTTRRSSFQCTRSMATPELESKDTKLCRNWRGVHSLG